MTQYFTNFDSSDYSLGDITAQGWTHRWQATPSANIIDDPAAGNGRALEVVADRGNNNMLLSWDSVNDAGRAELDILCRQKISDNSGTVHHGLAARASGGSSDPTGYAGHQKASNSIQLVRFNSSNSRDDLSESGTGGTITTGLYYFVRLRVFGSNPTTIELTRWEGGLDDEPASPDISYTDGTVDEIAQAGWVGVFKRAGQTYTWDWIGVGTNGDSAPTEPVSGDTSVNVEISTGTITITGLTQSIKVGSSLDVGLDSISVTGQQPTIDVVDNGNSVSTSKVGEVVVSGNKTYIVSHTAWSDFAEVLTEEAESLAVVADFGQLAVYGYAPDTITYYSDTIGTRSLTITGLQPSIETSEGVSVITSVGASSVTVTGETASYTIGNALESGVGLISVQGQQPTVQTGSSISLSIEAGFGSVEVSGLQAVTSAGVGGDAGTSTINVQGQSPGVITSDEVSTVVGTALVTVQGYSPDVSVTSTQHIIVGSSSIIVTGNQINFVSVSRETPDRRRIKLGNGGKQLGLAGNNRSVSVSLHSRKLKILPKQ